jgi:hypothetical protein
MAPKKDKKKKEKKAKPTKRTQQQKGKGQTQKQTQIVNINLAKSRSKSKPRPVSAVPMNIIRLNEPAPSLISQPMFPTRQPLSEAGAVPMATAVPYTEPYMSALPEVVGGATDPEKATPSTPVSGGRGRGRPPLSDEEIAMRAEYAKIVKKQKDEERFIARQKKAEALAELKALKGVRPVGRPRKDAGKVGGGASNPDEKA